jgi:hypothetical protein
MTQWKLVPVEPTEEMIKAVNTADCHNFELSWAEGYKAMLDAAPVLERVPESSGAYDMLDRFLRNSLDDTDYAEYSDALETVLAHVPTAQPAPNVQHKGWYCAHCGRGVDGSEVTFNEQHQVCGRVITNDMPPAQPHADVAELVEALKWIEKRCNEGLFEDGFFHQEHWKAAHDAGACARAHLKKWEGK